MVTQWWLHGGGRRGPVVGPLVVMLGPELSCFPCKLQVIVTGMSPWETTQINWANAPESITSEPKENGTILGGSKIRGSNINA